MSHKHSSRTYDQHEYFEIRRIVAQLWNSGRDRPSFIPGPDADLITFSQTVDWPAFGIEFVSSRRGDLDPEFLTMAVAVVGVSIADELTHLRPLFAIAPICVGSTEPDSLGVAYSVRIEDRIVGAVVHVIGVIEVAGNHP